MNEMFSIYKSKADLYDSLIHHEDYENNLSSFLNSHIKFSGKTVCEFGVGTGRVTEYYINKVNNATLCDSSQHMLDTAKIKLNTNNHKIIYKILDNKMISSLQNSFDITIEGWSFGHLISENDDTCDYWSNKLINDCKSISKTIIIIETLGTNVDTPKAPSRLLDHFYQTLKDNKFQEHIITTDYRFDNSTDAAEVLGAFFGEEMKNRITKENKNIIKEFTGIWIYNS
jgi:hypothetical protein